MLCDALSVVVATYLALIARFDFSVTQIPEQVYGETAAKFLPYSIILTLILFWLFHLYQSLWEYAGAPEEKLQVIQQYYDELDWQNYAIRVHALKSTSNIIGAGEVEKMARTLENAAKADDNKTVNEMHAPFMEKYKELLYAINDIFNMYDNKVNESHEEEALEIEPAEDEALEFNPVEDEALEFEPTEDEALEFGPVEDKTSEFNPVDDEALEFGPVNKEEEEN